MTIPLCNCSDHFPLIHRNKLSFPSFQFPLHCPSFAFSGSGYKKLPFYHRERRTSFSVCGATAADTQTLPQSAIHRIVEKLRSLGYVEESTKSETGEGSENSSLNSPSPGEIFVPLRSHLPKNRVGHTLDPSWSTPDNPVPVPGYGNAIQRFHKLRSEVLKEQEEERLRKKWEEKRERAPTLAQLTLPANELRRLRSLGIALKKKLKVGRVGITEGIVNGIHERWRRSELVKITCDDICRLNMKRTHDLLERKTGGLVIWRSGSNIILYRGADYKYPYFITDINSSDTSYTELDIQVEKGTCSQDSEALESPIPNSSKSTLRPLIQGVGLPNRVRFQLPGEAQLAEEADNLLEGLGPRFTEWWGYDPLPVDADLLPAIVSGYRRPFRLLPYGVQPKLTNDEMTTLRRLSLPLPCHFALGRNRKLQGLAASIVKLWEKCEIAKIAIKRGVQNTNSERMAEELKWLTGGTLLARDREFISLYRGKDFLPSAVSSAIEERRRIGISVLKSREDDKLVNNAEESTRRTRKDSSEVTLDEEDKKLTVLSEARKFTSSQAAIERSSTKLSLALAKKARAERVLEELEKVEIPQPSETDKEGITEEERFMLRKVGLRMRPFLLLGRRGVFDGTIENMHLHWKYRELVKILIGIRSIEEVHNVARTLEAESGGILVAIERVSKGFVIIVYRGKNYERPASLRPQTLLSKREAMKRSLEAQRSRSLKLHVLKLNRNIDELTLKLENDKNANGRLLAKDLNLQSIKEQEIPKALFDKDSKRDDQLSPATVEFRENHETDATSLGPEDSWHSSLGSMNIVDQADIPGGGNLHSHMEGKDVHRISKEEFPPVSALIESQNSFSTDEQMKEDHQPISVPEENLNSFSTDEQRENISLTFFPESRDQVFVFGADCIDSVFGGSKVDSRHVKLETLGSNSIQNGSAVCRPARLSNRERLILRKQALRMKYKPVLALGKRNSVTGVAKAIKAHFKKHPLAIVSIKGRATGTSIREVVYNLEQATGSVLVSQEPSKVILYRRGLEDEPPINDLEILNRNGDQKALEMISPELLSAIKLECGLESDIIEHSVTLATADE